MVEYVGDYVAFGRGLFDEPERRQHPYLQLSDRLRRAGVVILKSFLGRGVVHEDLELHLDCHFSSFAKSHRGHYIMLLSEINEAAEESQKGASTQ